MIFFILGYVSHSVTVSLRSFSIPRNSSRDSYHCATNSTCDKILSDFDPACNIVETIEQKILG